MWDTSGATSSLSAFGHGSEGEITSTGDPGADRANGWDLDLDLVRRRLSLGRADWSTRDSLLASRRSESSPGRGDGEELVTAAAIPVRLSRRP